MQKTGAIVNFFSPGALINKEVIHISEGSIKLYPGHVDMNKYLKIFSGTLMGVMFIRSAFAAADYAIVLKTLSNPFWVDMKKVLKTKRKRWV